MYQAVLIFSPKTLKPSTKKLIGCRLIQIRRGEPNNIKSDANEDSDSDT